MKNYETSDFHDSLILCPIFIKLLQFCLCFIALFIKIDLKLDWTFPLSLHRNMGANLPPPPKKKKKKKKKKSKNPKIQNSAASTVKGA